MFSELSLAALAEKKAIEFRRMNNKLKKTTNMAYRIWNMANSISHMAFVLISFHSLHAARSLSLAATFLILLLVVFAGLAVFHLPIVILRFFGAYVTHAISCWLRTFY